MSLTKEEIGFLIRELIYLASLPGSRDTEDNARVGEIAITLVEELIQPREVQE